MEAIPKTTSKIFGEEELTPKENNINARDEFMLKMLDEVYSKKDIPVKTDLSPYQVLVFSQAKIFASEFDSKIMSDFVDLISVYSLSKGRKSRKEFTEIAKAFNSRNEEIDQDPSITKRLLGQS